MITGISREIPNQAERIRTLGGSIYPGTPVGGYATNQTNFPGLAEWFFSTGISGNDLVGQAGILTITSSVGWTLPTPGTFRRNSGGTQTLAGTLGFGTNSGILICIGSINIAGVVFRIGNTTNGPSIGVSQSSNLTSIKRDISNYVNGSGTLETLTLPLLGLAGALNQESTNGTFVTSGYNGTLTESVNGIISGDISQSWANFTTGSGNAAVMADATSNFSGVYIFKLSSYPVDIDMPSALMWMSAHPGFIFPGFYKRS